MRTEISPNAQAILLLTAPLLAGQSKSSTGPLSAGEYRQLARRLRELGRQPADLLDTGARGVLKECRLDQDSDRLDRLLGRGFLLSQAMERWQTRAIWIVSRADAAYPQRLKKRLGENAPPILYGCGDIASLDNGGLAVVGSRNVNDTLIAYTEEVGRLTAVARRSLVSGGARGIDQAAMRGSLEAGGRVVGVLADGLEKAVMRRQHRDALMEGRLALVSPYDPAARFIVGHAMQRNKLIYALADAALVVNSDYGKGGTWAGAIEQLDKLKFVPIYVRADGEMGEGLDGLRKWGAKPWPNPRTPKDLENVLGVSEIAECVAPEQRTLAASIQDRSATLKDERQMEPTGSAITPEPDAAPDATPADDLFPKAKELIECMEGPRAETEIAEELQVSKNRVTAWRKRIVEENLRDLFDDHTGVPMTEAEIAEKLRIYSRWIRSSLQSLVKEGVVDKLPLQPVRYRSAASIGPLFDQKN